MPILAWFNATDFKLQDSELYKKTLAQYAENKYVLESTGFKTLPETINGRAAMLGAHTTSEWSIEKHSRAHSIPCWLPLPRNTQRYHVRTRTLLAGFLAGAGAEVFGAGPLLGQLSSTPQPVLAVLALITAGSLVPVIKGTEGGYLQSLRETYTLPEGVFTEPLERVHGRLAMVGVGGLVLLELLKGSAVL